MNAAQLIAWLICLFLGFFACVLAVHNMGQTNLLRRRVEELEGQKAAVESATEELKKIRRTLEDVEGKLDKAPSAAHDREGDSSPDEQENVNESGQPDES